MISKKWVGTDSAFRSVGFSLAAKAWLNCGGNDGARRAPLQRTFDLRPKGF